MTITIHIINIAMKNGGKTIKSKNSGDKKSKSLKIIVTISMGLVAAGGGVGLGLFFGQEFLTPQTNYNYNIKDLEDDVDSLYRKYKSMDESQYSSFKPYEMVNIGYKKLVEHSNFYSYSIGNVNASGILQTIFATSMKYDHSYFNESISQSSLVQVAKRFYQSNSGSVELYKGSATSSSTAVWDENSKQQYSDEEFEDLYGKKLSKSCIYIISSKTVKNSNIEFKDNVYTVELDLDPVLSVVRYVKQMSSMSDLSRNPEFHSVKITYKLDNSLALLEADIIENYEVYKFGKHKSVGTLTETFVYDTNTEIPTLDKNCNYGG